MSGVPVRKRLRRICRRVGIDATTALGIDARTREAEVRDMRERKTQIVRVLFLHHTPAEEAQRFREQLAFLRDHFNVIDFEMFKNLCAGTAALTDERPAAMLTFDDGITSNYDVAAPLLEQAGMRGLFFVVPQFSMRSGDAARSCCVLRDA